MSCLAPLPSCLAGIRPASSWPTRTDVLGRRDTGSGQREPGRLRVLKGGAKTIYVVDVDGDRLVITSHHRGASAEDIAELEAIIASIDIEPCRRRSYRRSMYIGRASHRQASLTVDGVPFSFSVPTPRGWERFGGISHQQVHLRATGSRGHHLLDGLPRRRRRRSVRQPAEPARGPSAADLAAAVATAPGTELVTGPSDVTVGGRAAKHVVLTVREDVGCDPGFFYTWEAVKGVPFWTTTAGRHDQGMDRRCRRARASSSPGRHARMPHRHWSRRSRTSSTRSSSSSRSARSTPRWPARRENRKD